MAEEKTLVGGLPDTGKYLNDAYASLLGSLESRQRGLGPTLLAIAQGATAPTKTGSFGESLGNIAGSVLKQQEEERKEELPAAQMRLQLAKGLQMQSLLPQLYKETPTAGGGTRMEFDPQVAKSLASATGDPKFLQMAYEFDKTKQLREAGQSVFTPQTDAEGKTTYKFNPNSVFALAKASDNPLETISKYADMVPKLRKAGMLQDLQGDITTPFDAIVLMADSLGKTGPAYKEQAQRLAKQYQTGMIDEDKANTLAQQMMIAINSSVDRQTAQKNSEIMQGFQRQMAQQTFELNQQKLQEKREENEKKLSDEQKITLNKIVTPIINEGIKGNSALMQVQALRDVIENAPSGTLSGVYSASVGRLFGTDDRTAQVRLQTLSKGLIPLIPRLPGSASNLDSNNLEKSLGDLADVTKTNEQRRQIINDVYEGFKRLTDRAERVQSHWDATKKFDPKILNPEKEPEQPKPVLAPATAPKPAGGATLRWNPATKQFE